MTLCRRLTRSRRWLRPRRSFPSLPAAPGANHTIALTGHQLTSFGGSEKGKDTDFIVYGLLDGSATTISHADVLRADNVRAAITLPDNLFDNQMYLVWPRTAAGVGRPVAVNQAVAQWAGPDKASAGETVSIFGENLVRIGTDDAKVWIEPADGSSNYYSGWVEATGNPYKIDFTLPTGAAKALAQFSNLWAHNFHGGDSGWSPPVTIEVRPSLPTTVSTAGEFPVDKYGAKAGDGSDDYTAITDAIAAARKHTNDYPGEGATVQFGKGRAYSTSLPLSLGGCVNISFEGTADLGLPATVIEAIPDKAGKRPVAVVFTDNNFANVRFRDIEFNDNKNLASIYSGPDLVLAAVLVRSAAGRTCRSTTAISSPTNGG